MNKIKVVIAEDNKQIAEFEKIFIEKNNLFDVVKIVNTSKEELELLERYSPDIIVTDDERKCEAVSGFDIILKCEKEKRDIKFILITATDKQRILEKNNYNMPRNIVLYIKKPFDWNILQTELDKVAISFIKKMDCDAKWKEKYYDIKLINLFKELNKEDLKLLKKLDISIKNEMITQYEYDNIKMKFTEYYDEDYKENKEFIELLIKRNINIQEYNKLLDKFDKLDDKYIFNK